MCEFRRKGSNFHRTLIAFALFSYGNFAGFLFLFADNYQIGYALEFVVADLAADLLVAVINLNAEIILLELAKFP